MQQENLTEIRPTLFTEKLVSVQAGEPYRLLPFGKLGRPGLSKNITPEFANQFKLPHFKPPIKLGSHDDATPAGGHILRLEVRDDGLYAIPEFTEAGTSVLNRGDYRYHSPEIIWEDEGIFDAEGNFIQGPLILGDALLHTPHLGEAAAMYGAEIYRIEQRQDLDEEVTLSEEKRTDMTLMEKILGNKLEDKITNLEAEKETLSEQVTKLEAAKGELQSQVSKLEAERDEAMSKLEAIEAEKEQAEKEAVVREALGEVELDDETVTLLSDMEEEKRDKLITKFKALHEQAKLGGDVEQELGTEIEGIKNPVQAFSVAVSNKQKEAGVGYAEALEIVTKEQPDIAQAYNDYLKGGK